MGESKLYIPNNVKTKSEIFEGYSKQEILQTVIATAAIVSIAFLVFSINKSVTFLIVFILTGIAGSVMCTTKDKNNQSVYDQLKNMVNFAKNQQKFEYKYMKEWGDA